MTFSCSDRKETTEIAVFPNTWQKKAMGAERKENNVTTEVRIKSGAKNSRTERMGLIINVDTIDNKEN